MMHDDGPWEDAMRRANDVARMEGGKRMVMRGLDFWGRRRIAIVPREAKSAAWPDKIAVITVDSRTSHD